MQGLKIFFACAFGALIGSFIALQLSPSFWWIGSIVGFMVGYLSYEFHTVIKVLQTILRYRPSNVTKLSIALPIVVGLSTAIIGFLFCVISHVLGSYHNGDIITTPFSFWCIGSFVLVLNTMTQFYSSPEKKEQILKELLLQLNPLTVYFYWLPKGIIWLVKKIPAGVMGVVKIAITTFRLIHSDARLMCGVNGAIGAGIGYFCGNALIGALAGGIFGVVNYYLVRIKVLKFAPVAK